MTCTSFSFHKLNSSLFPPFDILFKKMKHHRNKNENQHINTRPTNEQERNSLFQNKFALHEKAIENYIPRQATRYLPKQYIAKDS